MKSFGLAKYPNDYEIKELRGKFLAKEFKDGGAFIKRYNWTKGNATSGDFIFDKSPLH